MKSDIEIAQISILKPIESVAQTIGLQGDEILPYGRYIAKIPLQVYDRISENPDGGLILVSAMTPTPQGLGKTTTSIGLGQALAKTGKKAIVAIREPSLGPCMGMKGGAAGGGYSQVLPMEDINLHFTGDIHAVSAAHNLIAAVVDNHLHHKSMPEINARKVIWRRVIDMNDRSLRNIIIGLLENGINGVMREDGFDITPASEIMAIICLSNSIRDMKERIGRVIVGYNSLGRPVTASDIGISGAAAALLKNAIFPNLVQTIEGTPAFVHGGPFANIAHGCSTLAATRMALKLADYTITEAGFGADLGAEKFMNIKCRTGNLNPAAAVLVITKKACLLHGFDNILKHTESIRLFNVPVIISINRFEDDTEKELKEIRKKCKDSGIEAVVTDFRGLGGEGGLELAEKIVKIGTKPAQTKFLYDLEMPIAEKVNIIVKKIYGAGSVNFTSEAKRDIHHIENLGYGSLPVCMAKTPLSLTDNPKIPGRPRDFSITVNSAHVSAGAGFIVVHTGKILTMPGLPRHPAALDIDINEKGTISGLF